MADTPSPRRLRSKDLFQESTMTFGQHLEELRTCLFRAVYGLFLGILVGFAVGDRVVRYIASPLSAALEKYYTDKAEKQLDARFADLVAQGRTLPETKEQVRTLIKEEQLLPEEFYVNPTEVLNHLKRLYPESFKGVAPPAIAADQPLGRGNYLQIFLWRPLQNDPRVHVRTMSAQEGFSIYMKAAFIVGVIVASPWIFYQLWVFVGAGLYPHERRYVYVFLPFSVGLFLLGAGMTFFAVFPPVLKFFFYFNSVMGIEPEPRISEWLGFVLTLPLGFGAAFQLPLVMLFLERIHVFTIQSYLSFWRLAILVIAVIALLLTPDPSSMVMMMVPLTLLYFGGIALCRYLPAIRRPYEHYEEE